MQQHHPSFTPPPSPLTRPEVTGTFGMASSTHWLASATAQAVLERGGNAFDAATAAAFVLHVVEPHLNGPGGDMTAVFTTAEHPDQPTVLVGQGPAPAGATIEHFRAEGLDLIPGSGALAAAIPGAVDAWLTLLRDHGTWTAPAALEFAIDYARNGHPVLAAVCRTVERVADLFGEHWPTSAERWMPGGTAPLPGELITNPAYADLLTAMCQAAEAAADRADGIDAARALWRQRVGEAAEAAARTPHRHSDGKDHAGVIRAEDLAGFAAHYEPATTAEFRGFTVAKTGPWGQGPVLLQALKILEGYDDALLDPASADGAHTILEALKLAFADRDAWYGEDLTAPELALLLSEDYAAARRGLIEDTASAVARPGQLPGREVPPASVPGAGVVVDDRGAGEPTVQVRPAGRNATAEDLETDPQGRTRGDTCHLDVVDRWGNMIAATPSGGWLQSSPHIPELGFCLGTRLQANWLEPQTASALTPGRRPRTTLTPTLVLRGGTPIMALGTPGGDQQDQWQLPVLLRVLIGGYTPQQAIDAPTLHTTHLHSSFFPREFTPRGAVVEDRLGEDVLADLTARGHELTRAGDWALGRLSVVTRDPATGVLGAAANSRGEQGYAVGR
ncbi:gamma-glutamyltransferase family protein [Zhihengliuella flava]|uniref:Gamma-glutamyltranspeptidase/glutathione hydrolase n=1 Tax=Zhihengliuella flava TaxID=1285193 RepID=A0A931DCB8_9MICC|nr:gamma-glutamyltransferase [Zhihengliuella flava]MBG6084931.1 gamma-glutamyltranspeptidase/glutathione hydrolase [Zhihengliuella flava]